MRCGDARRPCGRAGQTTPRDEKVTKAEDSCEEKS
jgi:hypothetical protein